MEMMDRVVWEASASIAEAISESAGPAVLGQRIMDALVQVVPCDLGSIISVAPGQPWRLDGQKEDNSVLRDNFWRYAQQMTPREVARLAEGFAADRELFSTARRREHIGVYREFIEPNRQKGFMARHWHAHGTVWGAGLTRSSPHFTDRERLRLDALWPHVRAALRFKAVLGGELSDAADARDFGLTSAEQRTTALVVRGLTNREVACLQGTSPHTVRNTLVSVFKKLGVSRRSELAFIVCNGARDALVREARELQWQRGYVQSVATQMSAGTGRRGS
jgi:DNA-binding CsgD family transcriptional regulator